MSAMLKTCKPRYIYVISGGEFFGEGVEHAERQLEVLQQPQHLVKIYIRETAIY